MCTEHFRCTSFWTDADKTDDFWHPFTNVLHRPTDGAVMPDATGASVVFWARAFEPQGAGLQDSDDRAVREQVHARLEQLAEALRLSGRDVGVELARLGLHGVVCDVVKQAAASAVMTQQAAPAKEMTTL